MNRRLVLAVACGAALAPAAVAAQNAQPARIGWLSFSLPEGGLTGEFRAGMQLLGRRELSITEIALACGFSNATRFGVAFRKSFGTTPRAFRKTLIAD